MKTISLQFALLVAFAVAAAQVISVSAQSPEQVEVRIAAQRLADGRTEFALQQRDSNGDWSDRILPRGRYFPTAAQPDRWLNSTPLTLDDDLTVRITARRVANGRIEFALQQRDTDDAWGERMLPRSRFFPATASAERWLSSTPLSLASASQRDASFAPVIASGYLDSANHDRGHYSARRASATDGIRTDVRMRGRNGKLLLDALCRADESVAIGVRLTTLEHDAQFADELNLEWRIDDGPSKTDRVQVRLVGEQPSLYFDRERPTFDKMLQAASLTIRVDYRGVHAETFDMTAFRDTPVNGNLEHCGAYGTATPLMLAGDGVSLIALPQATHVPVIGPNDGWTTTVNGQVIYQATLDPFSDLVITEVRMSGEDGQLTLIAGCADDGTRYGAVRIEDASELMDAPARTQVTWRTDDGDVQEQSLDVRFLSGDPLVFLPFYERRFIDEILAGDSLTARINYESVRTDQFDLRLLQDTPVHDNLVHCGNYAPGAPIVLAEELTPLPTYTPVVDSNAESVDWTSEAFYTAERDAFSDLVRTDVSLLGASRQLRLDVVCFDNGTSAVGFRILDAGSSSDAPDRTYAVWQVDQGDIGERWLDLEFLGDVPAVYIRDEPDVLRSVVKGETLTARVHYRGVQEDVFDLNLLRDAPVYDNLVHCGNY